MLESRGPLHFFKHTTYIASESLSSDHVLDNKILANFLPLGVCSSLRRLVLWAVDSWERYLAEQAAKILGFIKGFVFYWVLREGDTGFLGRN